MIQFLVYLVLWAIFLLITDKVGLWVGLWGACVWVYRWFWTRRRIRLDDRATWWNYRYTDSETGQITIGLELVTPDHRMIDDVEMAHFPEHTPDAKLLNADELAMRRAAVLNVERTPERMRMYRIREAELEEADE